MDWDCSIDTGRKVSLLCRRPPRDYEIVNKKGSARITFTNSHIVKGVPIAIILQYGHGTRNGGWVEGRDYINPAIQPIFDELAEKAWKEVTKL